MKAIQTAAVIACASFGLSAGALAQDYSLEPTYGEVTWPGGFGPDPYTVDLQSGGSVDASRLGTICTGYIANAPDFRLNYQGTGWRTLYLAAQSSADTTLVVNLPDGSWVCNDDGGSGLNPLLSFDTPLTGQYDIWVGTYGEEAYHSARLLISENGQADFVYDDAYLDPSRYPAHGTDYLRSGFTRDPQVYYVRAGGTANAAHIGEPCVGFSTIEPSVTISFSNTTKFPLYFSAEDYQDLTLVVRAPDGRYYCDDDSGGDRNPVVMFRQPVDGNYQVWLGTYERGASAYTELYVSELGAGRPD